MAARQLKVRQESKSTARNYLKKARDNYKQMLVAFNASNWNAAATLALQCAISCADALCVHEQGIRSASQDHLDVCDLVGKLPVDGAREKANQLRKIITKKNMVQYECEEVREPDAGEMVKVTARIYQWVNDKISTTH